MNVLLRREQFKSSIILLLIGNSLGDAGVIALKEGLKVNHGLHKLNMIGDKKEKEKEEEEKKKRSVSHMSRKQY